MGGEGGGGVGKNGVGGVDVDCFFLAVESCWNQGNRDGCHGSRDSRTMNCGLPQFCLEAFY